MGDNYIPNDGSPVYGGQPVRIENIIEKIVLNYPDADTMLVQKAYIFAASAHQGTVRLSGEPYLNHPLAVADILCDMRLDTVSVMAGLLHDTVEDTTATIEQLSESFGVEVANVVDGVTKIGKINFATSTEHKASNMRKMILAMLTDLRVILVKLADRLNNMRTLGFMPVHKQKLIAEETLEIFSPLAARLGIYRIQTELEDLCFFYLYPKDYDKIREGLATSRLDRQEYVTEVVNLLEEKMEETGIKAQIIGRSKHIFSIWKKMKDQNIPFDQVYDITAFRIILENVSDCYSALGYIHSLFKPIPGRFKDYINLPKPNGYQSLHTSVMGARGLRMEVQIRTKEMHEMAENGVAAHWLYKDDESNVSKEEAQRIAALRSMKSIFSWQEDLDPNTFLHSVRDTLADGDSIFVFTPKGDVKELPQGSTPVDFAYTIHTMVGHSCVGAKVNGVDVPLRYKLNSGDIVEILTTANAVPSRDWLSYTVSPKARTNIKQWFAAEERIRGIAFGQEAITKEMQKYNLKQEKLNNEEVLKSLGFRDLDEVNLAIAFGKLPIKTLIRKITPIAEEANIEEKSVSDNKTKEVKSKRERDIIISGNEDILFHFATCCTPIPKEPVVGYITQGRGITIHSDSCLSLAGLSADRIVDVQWGELTSELYQIYLMVNAHNKPGTFAKVVSLVSQTVADILEAHAADTSVGRFWFRVLVKNKEHLDEVLLKLRQMEDTVISVERFYPEAVS